MGAVTYGSHHTTDAYTEVVKSGDIVVTTVRNHWDWFTSFWCLNGCPGKFDNWVREVCRDSPWIKRNPDCTRCELFWKYVPLANHIMRYESIEQDLTSVMTMNGFPKPVFEPWLANKRHYTSFYTSVMVEYIRNLFGSEINDLGYTFT